ncbi:MAG: septum formation inhibitor Maf [Clostridia bacterium]|nr:septum formation inhibitor Maf [Clostridia bacterium]
MIQIILASASPRRAELLEKMGLKFIQRESTVLENAVEEESPEVFVKKLALLKAQEVASKFKKGIVIGADTVVVYKEKVLGKPRDFKEAVEMLKLLSGSIHRVISGVALVEAENGKFLVDSETTRVHFRNLSEREILKYVSTGEPMDKAGAYGIQGLGGILVKGLEGCYYNVVGLPLVKLFEMMKAFGIDFWDMIEKEE